MDMAETLGAGIIDTFDMNLRFQFLYFLFLPLSTRNSVVISAQPPPFYLRKSLEKRNSNLQGIPFL